MDKFHNQNRHSTIKKHPHLHAHITKIKSITPKKLKHAILSNQSLTISLSKFSKNKIDLDQNDDAAVSGIPGAV